MLRKLLLLAIVATSLTAQQPGLRGTLGSGLVLLGKLAGANFNVTTDQNITINITGGAAKYLIRYITVTNASISLTTAAGGIYTAAAKGGTALVAAGQSYSALTAATITLDLTLAVPNATQTATPIVFSLTTPQGAAATADIYVFGTPMP